MSGVDWGAIAAAANAASSLGKAYQNVGVTPPAGYSTTATHPVSPTYSTQLVPGADAPRLTGPLSLPTGLTGGERFTWAINENPGNQGTAPVAGPYAADGTGLQKQGARTLTQMTLAGSLSWLRDLAAHHIQQYDEIVQALVQSGYLSPADARYGGYTSQVATKFLQSAVDTEQINNDRDVNGNGGGGAVTTWWNHIDSLIQGRKDAGQIDPTTGLPFSSGGGGGSGPTAPTRTDTYTNPEDVKTAINSAAESVLGRHLTDAEVAQFASQFHGQEKTYNDQAWAQQMASFNNAASAPDAVSRPSVSDSAQNYVDTSSNVAGERTQQLLGSYIGVLRNMTGLGAGGIARAVG